MDKRLLLVLLSASVSGGSYLASKLNGTANDLPSYGDARHLVHVGMSDQELKLMGVKPSKVEPGSELDESVWTVPCKDGGPPLHIVMVDGIVAYVD